MLELSLYSFSSVLLRPFFQISPCIRTNVVDCKYDVQLLEPSARAEDFGLI
jgi:hypothetical protein